MIDRYVFETVGQNQGAGMVTKRRWLQFSLRNLMSLFLLAAGFGAGWYARYSSYQERLIQAKREQAETLQQLEETLARDQAEREREIERRLEEADRQWKQEGDDTPIRIIPLPDQTSRSDPPTTR